MTTMTTTATRLTYGDTFELPGIPGVVWRIDDRRKLENAGAPFEHRAEAVPVTKADDSSGGARFDANGWRPLNRRGEFVRIGRAEREGVYIKLMPGGRYDPAKLGQVEAWAGCNTYEVSLTDAQSQLIEREVAAILPTIDLPPLTEGEILARMREAVEYGGTEGARAAAGQLPDRWGKHGDDGGRSVISAALSADDRAALVRVAAEAFAAKLADELRGY